MTTNDTTKGATMNAATVVEFVKVQLGIFCRTNGITTREGMVEAMNANKGRWVKMAIATA